MQLCIALDNSTLEENTSLIEALSALHSTQKERIWFKVGLRSFIRDGVRGLDIIKKSGGYHIFLDLKIYDIPNTMFGALEECYKIGIDMLTIHTSCGFEAMREIVNLKNKYSAFPLLVGVTALTSFDDEGFAQIYNAKVFSHSINLAKLAYSAGIDGVVCSVEESLAIKQATDMKFLTITPGIRPFGEVADDQKRIATLRDAKLAQSDFIVIGRPIYKAENPLQITKQILSFED